MPVDTNHDGVTKNSERITSLVPDFGEKRQSQRRRIKSTYEQCVSSDNHHSNSASVTITALLTAIDATGQSDVGWR